MEFQVKNVEVYGLERAVKASGNPMRTVMEEGDCHEKDFKRAINLGTAKSGEGHDNYLKGILVHMDVIAPLYWWKQAQRYHWFDFVSSQSTMHCLLKFDIASQCVEGVDEVILNRMNELLKQYHESDGDAKHKKVLWNTLVASMPCGFCLGATMTTNYQQLKTMYLQRKEHKLNEWHIFCDALKTLPRFIELTGVDIKN